MHNTLHSRSDIRPVQNMLSTTARQISCSGSGQDFQPWSTPRYCYGLQEPVHQKQADLGPSHFHRAHIPTWNSDAHTFLLFFQHLAGILSSAGSPPTFGSDEEKAMRNAIARVFPTSGRLVCALNAKKNLNANLANKVGLAQKNRKVIVVSIFGPNGTLMSETDHASLSDMMSHIADCHEDHVARYIRRLIPMLAEHMQATERQGLVIQTKLWTNNNCESINKVLKSYTSWKPLKLPELVPTLEEAVNAQYRETHRAILGLGNFELSEQFKKCFIPRDAFYRKTKKQRKAHMKKFFHAVAESNIVRATKRRSIKTARAPKHGGKKPCQRRRHRSERTQWPSPTVEWPWSVLITGSRMLCISSLLKTIGYWQKAVKTFVTTQNHAFHHPQRDRRHHFCKNKNNVHPLWRYS